MIVDRIEKFINDDRLLHQALYQISGYGIGLMVVDTFISPLVDALDETGHVKIIANCHGHIQENVISPPYVSFIGSYSFAQELAFAISPTHSLGMHYSWNLSAHFNPDRELQYCLSFPTCQLEQEYCSNWWWQKNKWRASFHAKLYMDTKAFRTIIKGIKSVQHD